MRFVFANKDKPHRCPKCHRIPEMAWTHGRAKKLWAYTCKDCEVFWTRLIAKF